MAIKYLNSISLEGNQIQNSLLQVLATNPTPLGEGQFFYNSATKSFNFYNGTAWVVLDGAAGPVGGITSIIAGTALNGGGSTSTVTINHDNFGTAGTYAYPTSVTTNAQGHITSISAGSAPGTMNSFTIAGDSGANQSISNGNTITFIGGTGITTLGGATDQMTITLALNELPANASALNKATDKLVGLWGGGTTQGTKVVSALPVSAWGAATEQVNMGSNKIVSLLDPTAAQDAATKGYVDLALAGSGVLIFQGGYNASTNSPNLDTPPTITINKGFSWTVTVDGLFFSEQVRVGDMLIANVNSPTTLADWTTVQSNIDLATSTTPGIASFPTAGGLSVSTGAVSIANSGVTASTYGNAGAVSTITVNAQGRITSASNTTIAIPSTQITDFCNAVDVCVSTSTKFTAFIGNGAATAYNITHSLNNLDAMVQLYEVSTGDTVYAEVKRVTPDSITVTFGAAIALNSIRVMIISI